MKLEKDWVKVPNGFDGAEFYGPVTLKVAGEQSSRSRWHGALMGWLRRPQARPVIIKNCVFYGAIHVKSWRRRVQLAFRCLRGWTPSSDPGITIQHKGDPT